MQRGFFTPFYTIVYDKWNAFLGQPAPAARVAQLKDVRRGRALINKNSQLSPERSLSLPRGELRPENIACSPRFTTSGRETAVKKMILSRIRCFYGPRGENGVNNIGDSPREEFLCIFGERTDNKKLSTLPGIEKIYIFI